MCYYIRDWRYFMRLSMSKSKNSTSLYVVKSVYNKGVRTTKVVEKLGTVKELEAKLQGQDPIEWAKEYIEELNKKEKEDNREIIAKFSPSKIIEKDVKATFNAGYLFLQQIYHELGLHKICKDVSDKYKFDLDLNSVLSNLIYSRILFPASKKATYELSNNFLEQPNFDLHQIYRALGYMAQESDFIQSELYKNSLKVAKRNTGILYYDCTNFFFEIDDAEGLKQYGVSKENKPNPIVQMGLFMDGDGMPLCFSITPGNVNEQTTLQPLEQKILSDFELSKFVVCTDAGLASAANRKFNDKQGRAFITTQSIKKLKKHLKEWSLDPVGWSLEGESELYNLNDIEESISAEKYKDKIFYKQRWIKENGFEQKLIVTYSMKYRNHQRYIRNKQIERAQNTIKSNPSKLKKVRQNDYKRLIQKTVTTPDGEVAEKEIYRLNATLIAEEERFDGFYAVCTNLEDDAADITKVNRRRWEIEECFRIMKSEFKARPVHLSRDDRIIAHFITCFISLLIYRILEKRLNDEYACHDILKTLREMHLHKISYEGYIPIYTRTDLTDSLHEAFGFRTDYDFLTEKEMKKIFKETKK